MSLPSAFKISVIFIVAAITVAGWVGLAGLLFGLMISVAALAIAFWYWRECDTTECTLLSAVASVGVPGLLSAFLGIFDESHDRVTLMSTKAYEFGSYSSDQRATSLFAMCALAGNRGRWASAANALVNIYIKDPVAAFYAAKTLPDTNVGEQICLEEFAKMREIDPELFAEFQEFWPDMPQIL